MGTTGTIYPWLHPSLLCNSKPTQGANIIKKTIKVTHYHPLPPLLIAKGLFCKLLFMSMN